MNKLKSVTKAIGIFSIALVLVLSFLIMNDNYGNAQYQKLKDVIDQHDIPESITVNGKEHRLNLDILESTGRVVYGDHSDVDSYYGISNNKKDGEWRYIGYTEEGVPYSNVNYTPDNDATQSVAKDWMKRPWENISGKGKEFIRPKYLTIPNERTYAKKLINELIDPYTGKNWLDSFNEQTGENFTADDMLDYAYVVFPSDYGPGYVYIVNNGGAWDGVDNVDSTPWYQDFVIPPLKDDCIYNCGDPTCEGQKITGTNLVKPSDVDDSSLVKVICSEDDCDYYYDYLDVSIEEVTPTTVKAGYGFSFIVKTDYTNEYYDEDDGWYGPSKVIAYFPKADPYLPEQVELVPLNPTTSWENTWVLPQVWVEKYSGNMFYEENHPNRDYDDELIDGGNKWYTPFKQPDGAYNFKIVAYNAGKHHLKDADSSFVAICGSPFDDYVPRLINPNNPFPGGIGDNWAGKTHIITELTDWYNAQFTVSTENNVKDDEPQFENGWVK